ncbi:MAG: hypothetical protein JNN30_16590 [Rhodanobacteraceae bacterium]|nr:hypothetical protein [Rhodanobacteraceae bacterium]
MALDDSAKANAAIHLAFEHVENTYCTPTWWTGLDEAARGRLVHRSMTGIGPPGIGRGTSSLANLEPILSQAAVVREAIFTQDPEVVQ